ncbi:hypothetical protein [Thermobispora bispora]|nr:hypothetical protein [Thermobispora bispora]
MAALRHRVNVALGYLATWLERRSRRSTRTAAKPVTTVVQGEAAMTG